MPKVEDMKKYAAELAKKAGLDEEQAKTLEALMDNDTIKNGFVARPNYSADLDSIKAKTAEEAKASAYTEAKAFYDKWWNETGEPAYKQSQAVVEKYAKYRELYGDLDGSVSGTGMHGNGGNGNGRQLSTEDVEKLLQERLAATNSAYINTTKQAMRVTGRHLKEFGEVLDPDELETFATRNGYTDIGKAYDAYVAPRREAKQQEEWEAKVKKAKEEGLQEGYTRRVNTAPGGREYVNPFLKSSGADPEAGRNAFFEAWDEHANK